MTEENNPHGLNLDNLLKGLEETILSRWKSRSFSLGGDYLSHEMTYYIPEDGETIDDSTAVFHIINNTKEESYALRVLCVLPRMLNEENKELASWKFEEGSAEHERLAGLRQKILHYKENERQIELARSLEHSLEEVKYWIGEGE